MADVDSIQTSLAKTETSEPAKAYAHLKEAFPYLSAMFALTGEVLLVRSREDRSISEAVVRIIAGQMLSGPAAETIYGRLQAKARELRLSGTHLLPGDAIRDCGLSNAKARAIAEFSDAFRRTPERFERWAEMDYPSLRKDVTSLWGLSDWSASIIALAHFGLPDVWPAADGSIQKACRLIQAVHGSFDPVTASPFRSYLARSLWAGLDSGYLTGAAWRTD